MNPETQVMFEKLVVQRGLITAEQLAEGKRLQEESAAAGRDPGTLLDALLEKGYGDRKKLEELVQVARVRSGEQRISIGGFKLLERIGRGGTGAVYRASQVSMGRLVAVKLMKPKLAADKRHLERFLREARASARLNHPNIVQGIDAGNDKGYYYFAMEFVDGDTLMQSIRREGHLPEDRCIEIGIQVARALEHADKFGIIHRDVKPQNILIDRNSGVAKLADLGLAKSAAATDTSVTQVGVAMGTPHYISPEQARGEEKIDRRSDIYSFGATLYHAATGTVPFEDASAPVVMSKHIAARLDPPQRRNPNLSTRFSRVIQKMMAKKREDRYQTASELLEDLERIASGEQPAAVATAGLRRVSSRRVKKLGPTAVIVTGVLAAAAILAVVLAYDGARRDDGNVGAVKARPFYKRAAELVVKEPTNFDAIIGNLARYLELAPAGPRSSTARSLIGTAKSFRRLAGATASTPDDWVRTASELKELSANAPSEPPYGKGILDYLRRTSGELASKAMSRAKADPLYVPQAAAWLKAAAETAPDDAIAAELAKKQDELTRILRENTDYILDSFAKEAEKQTHAGRFGAAIATLGSSIPDELMTRPLKVIIEKRIQAIKEAAAQHLKQKEEEVWGALDRGQISWARSQTEQLEENLGVRELEPQLRELCRTVEAAPEFLPLLDQLGVLKDAEAMTAVESELKRRFGDNRYVMHSLGKYQGRIHQLLLRERTAGKLAAVAKLIAEEKYSRADAAIDKLLLDPALTEDQRRTALGMQLEFSPTYVLPALFVQALKPRLPLQNVRLKLKGSPKLLACEITSASMESLTLKTNAGEMKVDWNMLGHGGLCHLGFGGLGLLKDDPKGLYYLAVLCTGKDNALAKRLLRSAVELAQKRTGAILPVNGGLIARAKAMLSDIQSAEAERAMERLAKLFNSADDHNEVERAIAAYARFKRQYGETAYVKKNADALRKIALVLGEAVLRDRVGPISKLVRDGDWRRLVANLEKAIEETKKIAPIPPERLAAAESLLNFGKDYLTEEIIYREVFNVTPWRLNRLDRLAQHSNQRVAARAASYSEIARIEVRKQNKAREQRRYAREEKRNGKTVSVKDVNVRLARYNAVFVYWLGNSRECAWAELDAARDFTHTGKADKNTGDIMAALMMEGFVERHKDLSQALLASTEYERLGVYTRLADDLPVLRLYIVPQAKQAMYKYRGTRNYPARFCLMVAEQYEAAGDIENAYNYYNKLCSSRSGYEKYMWRGYLGRGRIWERQEKYTRALADYERAFLRSSGWYDGYECAKAIVNLCTDSEKMDKPAHARKVVGELLKRAGSSKSLRKRTIELLEKGE